MNLNLTVNEAACPAAPPATPGAWVVRAKYMGQADAGHLYGPFATREAAEKCAQNLALRADVRSAAIEPA